MEYLEDLWINFDFDSLTPKQKYIAAAWGGVIAVVFCWGYHRRRQYIYGKRERERKFEAKRRERTAAFDLLRISLQGKSSPDEDITILSMDELISRLQREELIPTQVLTAYQKKALQVNDALNCVQLPISEAEIWAESLSQRTEKGPLYGIPVSIKDNIPVKGYDTTMGGCSSTFWKPYPEDAVIVKVLKKQGAVPFVLTNVPQTLFSVECVNPLYGQTKNPYDPNRTPGGSSGGEAAILAANGSVLGFGTDIGGSIRVPSAFCGICGLNPTVGRLSLKGFPPLLSGQTAIELSVGPMARDVESLVVAMKAVLVPYHWELDPSIVPYPFQHQIYEGKIPLRIGVLVNSGLITPLPACTRAVDVAVDAMRKCGHAVVQYKLPDVSNVRDITSGTYLGDGGKRFLELLNGDEPITDIKLTARLLRLPLVIRRILVSFLNLFMSEEAKECFRPDILIGTGSVFEWWELVKITKAYQQYVIDDWREKGIDALICPAAACYAIPYDMMGIGFGPAFDYTMVFNVLNFPAGVVPVTKVIQEDLDKISEYPAECATRKLIKKRMSEGGVGLPVAVQCAALPYQEELVLRVQREIQNTLKVN